MPATGSQTRPTRAQSAPRSCLVDQLRCVGGADASFDLDAAFALDDGQIGLALQVEPELRPIAEIAAEPERRIGADRPSLVEDIGDAAGGAPRSSASRLALSARAFSSRGNKRPGCTGTGISYPR